MQKMDALVRRPTGYLDERRELDGYAAERRRTRAGAKARSTRESYQRKWKAFVRWCRSHHVCAYPASPLVVETYAIHIAANSPAVSTVKQAMSAIAHYHLRRSFPIPLADGKLKLSLQCIYRDLARPALKADPLMPEDARILMGHLKPGLIGARDAALICFGLASGMRADELSRLQVSWLRPQADAYVLHIPKSKADQYGRGRKNRICLGEHESTCPVRRLRTWLRDGDVKSGPVFRCCTKYGTVLTKPLSVRRIDEIVREHACRASAGHGSRLSGQRYSSHSLRRGCCTALDRVGKTLQEIQAHVGHRDIDSTAAYVHEREVETSTVTQGMGL